MLGGSLSGALIRDVRLANELAARGWRVRVWWAMDRDKSTRLAPGVRQSWLFHGCRYLRSSGSDAADGFGRLLTAITRDKNRRRSAQKRPRIIERLMQGLILRVCAGVDGDRRLIRRFARSIAASEVTHLLPMLAILCPWVQAARRHLNRPLRYLVTFQGYELYGSYARPLGCERRLYDRLAETVAASDFPAVAVSDDYAQRVIADIGVPAESLRSIPPGVPLKVSVDPSDAAALLASKFPRYRRGVPLVTYLGRRDTEKGIDLLLYAASILRSRGLDFQVAVCGPTLFGNLYSEVCCKLAEDLRCPVLWSNQISDELRSALFLQSRCVVYPSIHREPFGMVAAESLAHGTPAIVPDYGGVAAAIEAEGETGGLRFRVWDSAHLADRIAALLEDETLYRRLADAGPRVAAHYSVSRLADRILAHIDLPPRPPAPAKGR